MMWMVIVAALGLPGTEAPARVPDPPRGVPDAGPPGKLSAAAPSPELPALHTELESSVPADGDTVRVMPERIRLQFNQAVDPALGAIRIAAADGREWTAEPASDTADARVVHAAAPRLPAGAYRLYWRVVSADGHAVAGDFAFHVSEGEGSPPAGAEPGGPAGPGGEAGPAAEGGAGPAAPPPGQAADRSPTLASLLRGIAVGLTLAAAGWLAFHAWLVPGTRRSDAVGLALAVSAVVALGAHLVAWISYIAPGTLGLDVVAAALGTASGRGEGVRLGLAALAALLVAARRRRVAAVGALLAVAAGGAVGHAAGQGSLLSVAAKSIHLVAVATWTGGLLTLVLGGHGRRTFPRVARRVSRAALIGVVVVAGTGVWQTLDLVPSIGQALDSTYGRIVVLKLAGLAALVAFGARHRFRLLPELDGEGPGRLRRSVTWETVVLVLVLLVAGFLAYVPPPEPVAALPSSP